LAGTVVPDCFDIRGSLLPIDNELVLNMKRSAPLGETRRAHVAGKVVRLFPDKVNGTGTVHAHFEIQIGDSQGEVLEVVYSEDFGDMPDPAVGSLVEACGDFINAYASQNGYPPSPSNAIIHWVHRSNSPRHQSGYVVIEGALYGNGPDRKKGDHKGGGRKGKPRRGGHGLVSEFDLTPNWSSY